MANVSVDAFPKQSDYLNRGAQVVFHDSKPELRGVIVRDDMEAPWVTIIRLEDGRHVLATECQYAPEAPRTPPQEPIPHFAAAILIHVVRSMDEAAFTPGFLASLRVPELVVLQHELRQHPEDRPHLDQVLAELKRRQTDRHV